MNGDDQQTIHALKSQLEDRREELKDSFFDNNAGNRPINQKLSHRRDLKGHFGKVYSIHWAGQGSDQLVSASQDGKLIVWNAHSTNKLNLIPLKSCWVMTCAFEKTENQLVACGGLENTCTIYRLTDAEAGMQARPAKELEGHDGYLSSCRFMGKNHMVTSSGDSTCRYWDVESGTCLYYFKEHLGDVMSVAPHPSNQSVFVSGSCDTECKLWDIRARGAVQNMSRPNRQQQRARYGMDEEVEGTPLGSLMTYSGHESDINSVAFFPDGNAFGTGSDDASCRLFDIRCHQEVNSFRFGRILCGITSVDFSSSGRLLFGGYDDFTAVGWDTLQNPSADTQEAQPATILRKHENRVSCVSVHSQGHALATGSWDFFIRVWA